MEIKFEPRSEKPGFLLINAKTKAQISCAVTAKLIRAFAFATRIVHFLSFINSKFQASQLHRPVCVRPDRKSRFSGVEAPSGMKKKKRT